MCTTKTPDRRSADGIVGIPVQALDDYEGDWNNSSGADGWPVGRVVGFREMCSSIFSTDDLSAHSDSNWRSTCHVGLRYGFDHEGLGSLCSQSEPSSSVIGVSLSEPILLKCASNQAAGKASHKKLGTCEEWLKLCIGMPRSRNTRARARWVGHSQSLGLQPETLGGTHALPG